MMILMQKSKMYCSFDLVLVNHNPFVKKILALLKFNGTIKLVEGLKLDHYVSHHSDHKTSKALLLTYKEKAYRYRCIGKI